MKKCPIFFGALSLVLAPLAGRAEFIVDPKFSLDPASPSIDGVITPDDVLRTGPAVFTPGTDLGLLDDFFGGNFDNLNALSYGRDPIRNPLYFSVDRVAVGLPGTAVEDQAQPGSEEAAGDVYRSLPPFGSNALFIDEEALGLIPGFFGDDLNALELNGAPEPFTYFSIDFLSASNGFGAGDLADDILISDGSGSFGVFAEGMADIGLLSDDDLDALVLLDRGTFGALDPGVDRALFSLSTFSPSTFTFTGNPYVPGVQAFLSPADVLFTDFTGDFTLWAPAAALGLRADDELDALDTIPAPGGPALFGIGLLGMWASGRKRRRLRP